MTPFDLSIFHVDLEADLAFGEVGGELLSSGDLDAVDPDGAGAALDEDLEEEPAAFDWRGNRGTLDSVDAAGGVDAVEG